MVCRWIVDFKRRRKSTDNADLMDAQEKVVTQEGSQKKMLKICLDNRKVPL